MESSAPVRSKITPSSGATDWADWLDSYEGLPSPRPSPAEAPESRGLAAMLHYWLDQGALIAPGIALAGLLSLCAYYIADWTGRVLLGFAKSPIGAIPAAVLLGAGLRNMIGLPKTYEAGLRTCVRFFLRIGIVLLGLRLSLATIGAVGLAGLPIITCSIAAALGTVAVLSQLLRLPSRQGQLIAVGTSICGVSAIAAAAPVIDADQDEVSYSIACITLFGMLAMFVYPLFALWVFDGDHALAGYFLGLSIHDTAQVAGSAMIYRDQFHAPETLDIATVTKLVRNTSMIVVIPLMGFLFRRSHTGGKGRFRWSQAIPFFVFAYLFMALVRSAGDAGFAGNAGWNAFLLQADQSSAWLLATAMAAVGLGTDTGRVRKLGWRPLAAGFAAAIVVAAVSLTLLKVFPPLH